MKKDVHTRLPEEVIKEIEEIVEKYKTTKSEVIRRLILSGLEREKDHE